MMRVAILGGGVAGLAAGLELARAGCRPSVLEPARELGDPGPRVALGREELDPFVHPVRAGDTALLGLLAEVGELGRVRWTRTRAGLLVAGEARTLRDPLDFLRGAELSWSERQRARAAFAYATRLRRYALDLDVIPALDWLERLFGERVCEAFWRPYLRRRFGDYADELPAHWAWSFLAELSSAAAGETWGHVRGGARGLLEVLCEALEARGGSAHVNVPVTAIEQSGDQVRVELGGRLHESFDALVSTLPLAELAKLLGAGLVRDLPAAPGVSLAKVSAIAVLARRLARPHRTLVLDPEVPFDSLVEASQLLARRDRHAIYFERSAGAHTAAFTAPDEQVAREVRETLVRCYGICERDVEAVHVSRAAVADGVSTLAGVGARSRSPRLGESRLFVCSKVDAYPRPPSWDTEVRLAREVAARVRSA